jgi:fructokinase
MPCLPDDGSEPIVNHYHRHRSAAPHDSALVAGVELGGTKCVCTLGSGPGDIREQRVVPTTTPEATLAAVTAVLAQWRDSHGFAAIGIGSFGPVSLDPAAADYGHVQTTSKPGWSGSDIVGAIAAAHDGPVAFDTDVNAAALAEMRWGAGRGLADFAYITVGTGVGVGLIVHGAATRGIGHSELGHVRVPRLPGDRAASACPFHDDCVEGLASGGALRRRVGADRVAALGADDPVWEPVVAALAGLCHILACATGPQRIAIGGGVVTRQPHLLARIDAALRASINGYLRLPESDYIVAPALGDQAGPMGSIALGLDAVETMGETA